MLNLEHDYEMKVIKTSASYIILRYGWFKKIYYHINYNDPSFSIGDKIYFYGYLNQINFDSNVYSFDFQGYLNDKNIFYEANFLEITKIEHSKLIVNSITNYVSDNDKSGLINLLVLGQHQSENDDLYKAFVDLNLVHLIFLSGMHINILSWLILLVANKIHKSKYNFIYPSIFSVIYWILLSFQFSIFRSIIMLIFFSINKHNLNSKYSNYQIWIVSILTTNIIYPFEFLSTGFIYSYLTTFGLIILSKRIEHLNIWFKILIFNIGVWFITLGVNVYFNYRINFLSIIYNIILGPIISLTFIILIVTMWFPFNYFFAEGLSFILINIVNVMVNFNWQFNIGKLNFVFILLYYSLLIFIFSYFHDLRLKMILLSSFVFLLCSWNWMILPNYQIVMLDVGNGNSIVVQDKYHFKNFMFDAGVGINHYESQDQDYLEYAGISWLNDVIISHYHADHYNNYEYIKEHNIVFNYIDNSHPMNQMDKIGGCKLYYLNNNFRHSEDKNDNSLVILLQIYDYKMLLTGDATKIVEEKIGNDPLIKDVDFLQVSHHGSNTSTSVPFLNWVNPTNALISATHDQQQNFPTDETMEKLNDVGCENIYITSQVKNIKIKIWKHHYKIVFF